MKWNAREDDFVRAHTATCDGDISFEPRRFPIVVNGIRTHYTPDFYCARTETFYEVIGSPSAFRSGKYRLRAFLSQHPAVPFRIVNPDGSPYLFKSLDDERRRIRHFKYDPERIRRARMARGLSRAALAKASGLAPSTVCRVEFDLCQTPTTLKALADALELNLADLVIDDEPERAVNA